VASKDGLGTGFPAFLEIDSADGSALTLLNGGNIQPGTVGANQLAPGSVTVPTIAAGIGVWTASGTNVYYTNGNVGIGTVNPTRGALEVDGYLNNDPNTGPIGYLTTGGVNTSVGSAQPVSIYANNVIWANSYLICSSDARIKNIIGQSDGARDLNTLMGIEITDYTFKDAVTKGGRPQKKVIGQQLETVYPQAVCRSTDAVPDIYQEATVQGGWVHLATNLKVGERVRLIGEKEPGIYVVLEVRDGAFRSDFKPATERVFVYGREVNDFRTVDYDAISMLNVSATQELSRKLDAQQAELTELQTKFNEAMAEKETILKRLVALETRDLAREDRLAQIEGSEDISSARTNYASVDHP